MPQLYLVEVKYRRVLMAESKQDAISHIGPVCPIAHELLDDALLNGLCAYLKQLYRYHRTTPSEMMEFTETYLDNLDISNSRDVADYIVNTILEEFESPESKNLP